MEQAALKNSYEEFYDTDISVGEILRRTRVHYGQSLADVERSIRVRASQIQAIEQDHTDELPGRVYAIGFVRSYSEYLGLDGAKMVALFKAQQGEETSAPALDFPVPASESKLPPIWLILLALIVTISVPFAAFNFFGEDSSSILEIPDVPEQLKAESLSVIHASYEDSNIKAGEESSDIFINVTENSWIEIKDLQDEVLVSRILQSGEQYYIPNNPDLRITLGNAGGVSFDAGDGVFVGFGVSGQSLSDIPLDLNHLKKYFTSGASAQNIESKTE